jgi:hypothetical protein
MQNWNTSTRVRCTYEGVLEEINTQKNTPSGYKIPEKIVCRERHRDL